MQQRAPISPQRKAAPSNGVSPRKVRKKMDPSTFPSTSTTDPFARDNQERRSIFDAENAQKYRRKRNDLKPISDDLPLPIHPIIRTSIAADMLDQRLCNIKQQIDHVLLGGMLKEDSPRKPAKESPRPMTIDPSYSTIANSPVSIRSTVLPSIDASFEAIAKSQLFLCADDEIEKWIQNYEAEKHRFTSYALFTEYKLDQLTNFTANCGRPNVIETAACCAALFKIPGILGNYRSLLQKIVVGLEYGIYGDSICESAFKEDLGALQSSTRMNEGSSVDVVRSFYKRKPFFVQLQEVEHDHALSVHFGGFRRASTLLDHDKRRVVESCSPELLEYGLLRLSDEVRKELGMKLIASVTTVHGTSSLDKAQTSDVCRRLLKLAEALDTESRGMVVASLLEDLDPDSRIAATFNGLGTAGETKMLQLILGREEKDKFQIRDTLEHLTDASCLLHMYIYAKESYRVKFLRAVLENKHEYEFICDLAKVISNEQLEQLTDYVNGAKHGKLELELTGLSTMTSESLHTLLTAPDTFSKPLTPSEQRRFFDDVCTLLRNWSSDAIDFSEHLLDKCRSLHPSQRKFMLTALMKDDFHTTKAAMTDYFLHLNGNEKHQIQVVLHDKTFLMSHFKDQLSAMPSDMRANVLYAAMEALRAVAGDADTDVSDSKQAKSLVRYCRELFGLTIHTDKNGQKPATSNHAPTTTETASHALDVLHQLDPATRNTIIQSLVQSIDIPKPQNAEASGPGSTPKPVLSEERKLSMLSSIENAIAKRELSIEEQIVSGMTEQDASELLQHVMKKSQREFAKVAQTVVHTFESTGQGQSVENVLDILVANSHVSQGEGMTHEQRKALDSGNAIDKLCTMNQISLQRARAENGTENLDVIVENDSDTPATLDEDNVSEDEHTMDISLKPGMTNVACQTDVNFGDEPVESIGEEVGSFIQKRKQPVTLTSLTRKTKGKKVIKIDSGVVPYAFASLVTSWNINVDQLSMCCKKPLGVVLRTIADTYAEKIVRIKKGDASKSKKDSLAQITYQSLLHSYGLPSIADMHIIGLGCALDLYRSQHIRVDMFCQFIYNEVPTALLSNYLAFLEVIVDDTILESLYADELGNSDTRGRGSVLPAAGLPPNKKKIRFNRLNIPDKEEWTISMDRAIEITQYCFRSMRRSSITSFCDKITQGTPRDEKDLAESYISVDILLGWVVAEWKEEQIRRDKHLLDAFRAGDNNGDGQLSFEEFRRIVLSINKTREDSDILLMFSDTLRRTGSETISPDDFLVVAKEYGLTEMAWESDGELSSIVNGLMEMNNIWATVRPFFVGTLQAMGRDLPSNHFLRLCQGAGCGCLKCLVYGFCGFQVMRGVATDDSEHAVAIWKRFWHLMTQLYEACDKSDGIYTPWNGSIPIRKHPASHGHTIRSNTSRRHALPNIFLPDINRISGKMTSTIEYFNENEILNEFSNVFQ